MDTKKITVYDNGGETLDRYTVITPRGVFGMSRDALSPQGFNMYLGERHEFRTGALGDIVTFESLDDDVQEAIRRRMAA